MKQTPKLLACAFATILIATGCSTFFKRTPAQVAALPKHYVMTLHGVRGNEASYGDFHKLVKMHLEKIDPGFEVIPLNFTYKTAQVDYTPHQAAAEINQKLDQAIPTLNPNDKISVVAYSMGGQVGIAWYYDSLKDEKHQKYPMQTSNFISLSAAFWGAEEAGLFTNDIDTLKSTIKSVVEESNKLVVEAARPYTNAWILKQVENLQKITNAKEVFPVIDRMKSVAELKAFYDTASIRTMVKNDWAGSILDRVPTLKELRDSSLRTLAKISFAELQALSIGGVTVSELRGLMISAPQTTHTQWTSISTLVQCFEDDKGAAEAGCNDFQNKQFASLNKELVKYNFGFIRRETDNAVITPSSIAQFYYANDKAADYAANAILPASKFRLSLNPERHKTIFAETLHATLVTEGMYNRSIDVLGKFGKSWSRLADDVVIVHAAKCTTPETCDHPVYKYVLDELADCAAANSTCDKSEYNNLVKKFQQRNSSEESVETVQGALKSELHGFTLELNLRTPQGYDLSKVTTSNLFQTALKVDFDIDTTRDRVVHSDGTTPYKIHLGRQLELGSIIINKVKYQTENHLKLNLTGLITTDDIKDFNVAQLQNGIPLKFTVALAGLKPRVIEAVVSPYHSTFIDVVMAK